MSARAPLEFDGRGKPAGSVAAERAGSAREQPVVLGCALTELCFLRVSMADKTIAASFTDAEAALPRFIAALGTRYHGVEMVSPGPLMRGQVVRTHKEVSDLYLSTLAEINGAKLATVDTGIKHPAAVLIA
jgi:hypothetical protein